MEEETKIDFSNPGGFLPPKEKEEARKYTYDYFVIGELSELFLRLILNRWWIWRISFSKESCFSWEEGGYC
jgi:hypothetical protein